MKKKKKKKGWIAVIVIIVLALLLFGGGNDDSRDSADTENTPTVTDVDDNSTDVQDTDSEDEDSNDAESESADSNDAESEKKNSGEKNDGISKELKEFLESYEEFMDEYCRFLENYDESDTAQLTEYLSLMGKCAEFEAKADAYDEEDMNEAESDYYLEVLARVEGKLLKATAKLS